MEANKGSICRSSDVRHFCICLLRYKHFYFVFSSHLWAVCQFAHHNIISSSLFCHFYRSLLFKLIWLLHFGSLNHWTWACGSSSCSSTSFLKPGTTTYCISPFSLLPPLFAIYRLPSSQSILLPRLHLSCRCPGDVFWEIPVLIRLTVAAAIVS